MPALDTRALTIQSPSSSPFRNDFRGAFTKNHNYRMEFTKGHYERTYQQNIKDPFKLNYLSFETTRQVNQDKKLRAKQQDTEKMKYEAEAHQIKRAIVSQYEQHFGIVIELKEQELLFKNFDTRQLEMVMEKKLAEQKQYLAAQLIQSRFRGFLCRKWYSKVHEIRVLVAIKIQRLWRVYYRRVVLPGRQKRSEREVVILVQSCLRGYSTRKGLATERSQQKMELAFEYFEGIKRKMEDDAILKILFRLKKFSRAKRLKRLSFMQEKQNAKGKKGKVSTSKKKNAASASAPPKTTVHKPAPRVSVVSPSPGGTQQHSNDNLQGHRDSIVSKGGEPSPDPSKSAMSHHQDKPAHPDEGQNLHTVEEKEEASKTLPSQMNESQPELAKAPEIENQNKETELSKETEPRDPEHHEKDHESDHKEEKPDDEHGHSAGNAENPDHPENPDHQDHSQENAQPSAENAVTVAAEKSSEISQEKLADDKTPDDKPPKEPSAEGGAQGKSEEGQDHKS